MQTHSIEKSSERKAADVVVVPFWHEKTKAIPACDAKEFAKWFHQPIHSGDFQGKEGETLLLYRTSGKEKRILLLGLGNQTACLPDTLRKAYASSVKAIKAKKLKTVNFLLPQTQLIAEEIGERAVFEGVLLSHYTFVMLKGNSLTEENHAEIAKATFIGGEKGAVQELKKIATIVDSVNFVRDLINGNADEVTSESLSAFAKGLEKESTGIKTKVLGKAALEKEEMGLILAVNRAAIREPALIVIEYLGDPSSKDWTAIVGKGITYDTGGLNIKSGGMETMKCDMSGAAATLGIVQAAARLKLKRNIIGVLAVAENAVGPNSYKPGDVFKSHAGKTVEISNTDAEGRLVLADAFSYVQKHYKPSRLIDMATLTGGIVIALGEEATGLFCNDDTLAKSLCKAGERTHERLWRMPLYPEYKDLLKSSIADLKNACTKRVASSCSAALFLQQFIDGIPWAHLDIAGTAYLSEIKGYHTTPATGVGVRLLLDFLEHLDVEKKGARKKAFSEP